MKLSSLSYKPNLDCYSISTQTPTEGRVVLPEERLVLCGMAHGGSTSWGISRGECESSITPFPERGARG